jgi:5,10-methylenetetrahydromethanopterin reductase
LRAGAAATGRHIDPSNFLVATLTTIVVLEPGEAVDSTRVRADAGAFAIAGVHYAYEQYRQYGRRPPAQMADIWDDYVAMVEDVPEERRHLRIHEGHNCWVVPEEERFLTAEVLEASCLIGTPEQLAVRLRDLQAAGLGEVVLLPPLAPKERVLRDVAEQVMPRVEHG